MQPHTSYVHVQSIVWTSRQSTWDIAEIQVWWPWLPYTLFSRDASHTIETAVWVQSMGLVASIREVLINNDPAVIIFQRPGETNTGSSDVVPPPIASTVDKTATVWLGFHSQWSLGTSVVAIGEPGVAFHVLRNRTEEDFIEFILPGCGVAWAKRAELVDLQPLPRRMTLSIRHLKLMVVRKLELQPTAVLLEVIGEPLERLSIADDGGINLDSLLESIVKFAPT